MEREQGEVFARFGMRLEPELRFLEREGVGPCGC
jgi:hypothetical protein